MTKKTPMTKPVSRHIQSVEAKKTGGLTAKGTFLTRAQRTVDTPGKLKK